MIPKTRLQHKVVAANKRLLPLTENQQNWAYRNVLQHYAYRTPTGKTTCLECNGQWRTDGESETCRCPRCGAKLKVVNTLKKKDLQSVYFSILTTESGLQVQRVFRITATFRKLRQPAYYFNEVCRLWMNEDGWTEVTGLCRTLGHYIDSFIFNNDIDLRKQQGDYKYIADISFLYPRYKVLPVFRRNGVRGTLPNVSVFSLLHSLLADSRIETMMKAGDGKAVEYFMENSYPLETCRTAYKIARRNGYDISDYSLRTDYISLLIRNGNDIHNPHFVCPQDLQTAHDKLLHAVHTKEKREKSEAERLKALEDEAEFEEMKKQFFGLHFSDGEIDVHSLDSVEAYMEESAAMHHCCFKLAYYLKPQSLCLSPRIGGKRIETVELSLTTFKVIQSRGVCNTNTEYHDRIIALVERNSNLVKERIKA